MGRLCVLCPLAYFALLASAWADTPRVLPAGQRPHDKRLGPLVDLNGYFPFAPPTTRDAWMRRAEELRRQVLVAAGLWPMPVGTVSKAVVYGAVDRAEYTVEKVYFESYPGFFVTGNLYRPKKRAGKLPAILSPHGHWPEGRFYDAGPKQNRNDIVTGAERFETSGRFPLQARCVQLARMGCIVFHYDMVGYADSQQLAHRAGDRPEMDDPKRWGFFSPQAEARLQTIFGLQTFNSICALDFVCGLPDVDPARIGVTGASGGATQTFILGAIDPRPAVIFPAVMVSTSMQGGCPCENASYLRIGTGNIELAGLFAPKPLGMTAADDWTKEIATKGLPQLKQLYRLFGAEDRVMAKALLQFPHNYNYVSRAVMYSWFNKHFKLGLPEPIVEEDFRPLTIAEMSVWDERHPQPPRGVEFERSLLARMTDDSQRQIEALAPTNETSLKEYRRIVGGAAVVMIGRNLPQDGAVKAVDIQSESPDGHRITKLLLRNVEHDEELPCIRLEPASWNHRTSKRGMVIWVDPLGKQGLFNDGGKLRPSVIKLLDRGFAVVAADLFGQGEFTNGTSWTKGHMIPIKYSERKESWGRYAGYTYGYNRSLFAQRVDDVLLLVSYARSGKPAAERVDVIGLAGAGQWVAAARAIAGAAIDRAAIDTDGFRFANLTAIDDANFLPGGAKYGDLPGIIALSAPYPLWLAGEGQSPALVVNAYRAAGHADRLTVLQRRDNQLPSSESAAIEWLLKDSP